MSHNSRKIHKICKWSFRRTGKLFVFFVCWSLCGLLAFMGQCSAIFFTSESKIVEEVKINLGGALKDALSRRKMHFFFCKRYIFPIFPLTFFWKLNGIYSWSLFLKLKNRKNSIFGKIFILLYLQITCYRDMQLTCVSIYQYGSSYIIKTLTGWNSYEERKHQGILSFYPERIIDKKDYWHELFSKTSKKLNSWLPRQVKARQRCHRLLWITGCDTQYNSPGRAKIREI